MRTPMPTLARSLTTLALLYAAAVPAALAASSTSSAASDSASTSVGSASNSVQKSSDSSSGEKRVAAGDYQIVDVVAVAAEAGQPGLLRLKLQAVADASAAGAFFLLLPEQAFARGKLAAGERITARQRPYGLELARADLPAGDAFFLVMDDAWHRELQSNPVVL